MAAGTGRSAARGRNVDGAALAGLRVGGVGACRGKPGPIGSTTLVPLGSVSSFPDAERVREGGIAHRAVREVQLGGGSGAAF